MLKIKYTKSLKGSRKYVCICVHMYTCMCSCVHMHVCSCKKQYPSQSNPTCSLSEGLPLSLELAISVQRPMSARDCLVSTSPTLDCRCLCSDLTWMLGIQTSYTAGTFYRPHHLPDLMISINNLNKTVLKAVTSFKNRSHVT